MGTSYVRDSLVTITSLSFMQVGGSDPAGSDAPVRGFSSCCVLSVLYLFSNCRFAGREKSSFCCWKSQASYLLHFEKLHLLLF